MNSLRRFAMLVVALAMLGATGAVSQDAVLLQYRMTEDTVRAMDVVSNQTGRPRASPRPSTRRSPC